MSGAVPLLAAHGLRKSFRRRVGAWGGRSETIHAVDGVDLRIDAGQTVGLVGESGSGKSTLARLLTRLVEPDAGRVLLDGTDLLALGPEPLRRRRRELQMVFQDSLAALNPRMRVERIVGEPLLIHGLCPDRGQRRLRVAELLDRVGLDRAALDRYPHEFSGGQRQRIGIARAIACEPRLILAEQPVSALDPPIQAQIVNLMLDLQRERGIAYLFIAHDLRLVERFCDRVLVMYLGRIVEEAAADRVFGEARHPYTRLLRDSTPQPDPARRRPAATAGEPAPASRPPSGCPFHPRCPWAEAICRDEIPDLIQDSGGHKVACHLATGETPVERRP